MDPDECIFLDPDMPNLSGPACRGVPDTTKAQRARQDPVDDQERDGQAATQSAVTELGRRAGLLLQQRRPDGWCLGTADWLDQQQTLTYDRRRSPSSSLRGRRRRERDLWTKTTFWPLSRRRWSTRDQSDAWLAKKRTAEQYYAGELPRQAGHQGPIWGGQHRCCRLGRVDHARDCRVPVRQVGEVPAHERQDEAQAELETQFTHFVVSRGQRGLYGPV